MLKKILYRLTLKAILRTLAPVTSITMLKQSRLERPLFSEIGTACTQLGAARRWLLVSVSVSALLILFFSSVAIGGRSETTPKEQIDDLFWNQYGYLCQQWKETKKIGNMPDSPERPILVIDIPAGELRLERPGPVHPAETLKLSKDWIWQAVYWDNTGSTLLEGPIRLRMRTGWSSAGIFRVPFEHQYPELIEIRGTHRRSREKYNLNISSTGPSYGQGFMHNLQIETPGRDSISQRVSESEYETARKAWAQMAQPEETSTTALEMEERWVLFQTQQVSQLRIHLATQRWKEIHLSMRPNPDFQRGRIEVKAVSETNGPLRHTMFGGNGYDLQYLGGETWALLGRGVLEGDNMALSGDPKENVETWREAFVRTQAEHEQWLKHLHTWDPRFTATLADGTQVELIGLSEGAGRDAKWWCPDGTPLDWQPYVIPEERRYLRSQNHDYVPPQINDIAYAYRITPPLYRKNESIRTGRGSFARSMGTHSSAPLDPWGWDIHSEESPISGEIALFEKNLKTADYNLTLTPQDGREMSLSFRNVALYPDQPTTVTIETSQKEGR